jgi:hypothetical protein
MRKIYLKFTNGLSFSAGVHDILSPLKDEYEFIESNDPEFIIFGPYGNAVPEGGGPKRIGYFCENLFPDMSICDWAFGMLYEEDVGDPRYRRIQWHGVNPQALIKPHSYNPEDALKDKTKFCNFVFSNPVPYRERFFRELSKYKHVDAPGRSMNNMASIDVDGKGDLWQTKRRFLEGYKFTIAFENYSFPGYNTEKLLDPMLAGSLPIYFGNPRIGEHFNQCSFVNAHQYVDGRFAPLAQALERWSQASLGERRDCADLPARINGKLKGLGRSTKMRLQSWDFNALIEHIARIDLDDDLYRSYAAQPWFVGNVPPSNEKTLGRWRRIFSGKGCERQPSPG